MKEWVEWVEGPGLRYEPIVRAAIAHFLTRSKTRNTSKSPQNHFTPQQQDIDDVKALRQRLNITTLFPQVIQLNHFSAFGATKGGAMQRSLPWRTAAITLIAVALLMGCGRQMGRVVLFDEVADLS